MVYPGNNFVLRYQRDTGIVAFANTRIRNWRLIEEEKKERKERTKSLDEHIPSDFPLLGHNFAEGLSPMADSQIVKLDC